jgi:hypothetical protein
MLIMSRPLPLLPRPPRPPPRPSSSIPCPTRSQKRQRTFPALSPREAVGGRTDHAAAHAAAHAHHAKGVTEEGVAEEGVVIEGVTPHHLLHETPVPTHCRCSRTLTAERVSDTRKTRILVLSVIRVSFFFLKFNNSQAAAMKGE